MNSERINFTCAKIVVDELNFSFWSSEYYELDSTDETKSELVSYVTRYPAPLVQDMLCWINTRSMKNFFREEITWNGVDSYVHEKILTQLSVLKSMKPNNMKENTLNRLAQLINSVEPLTDFSRKEIKDHFKIEHQWQMATIDSYRNMFAQAGYIKIVKRGVYQKIVDIPESMTWEKLYEEAYGRKAIH